MATIIFRNASTIKERDYTRGNYKPATYSPEKFLYLDPWGQIELCMQNTMYWMERMLDLKRKDGVAKDREKFDLYMSYIERNLAFHERLNELLFRKGNIARLASYDFSKSQCKVRKAIKHNHADWLDRMDDTLKKSSIKREEARLKRPPHTKKQKELHLTEDEKVENRRVYQKTGYIQAIRSTYFENTSEKGIRNHYKKLHIACFSKLKIGNVEYQKYVKWASKYGRDKLDDLERDIQYLWYLCNLLHARCPELGIPPTVIVWGEYHGFSVLKELEDDTEDIHKKFVR